MPRAISYVRKSFWGFKRGPEKSEEAKTDVPPKIKKEKVSKKVCLSNFAALKTGKRHPFYVFSIQIIVFLIQKKGTFPSFGMNFSPKLADAHPGQNVGKRTPPQIWGAELISKLDQICLKPLPECSLGLKRNSELHK